MNLAMIFAMLLQSGVCAQSEFHDASGRTLMVMVCPRMTPDDHGPASPDAPATPDAPAAPEAPPAPPSSHT
jgi:hypothetical protein